MPTYWLVKSEPEVYSWEMFVAEKQTYWNGVRNYQARNNLRDMQVGDLVLYYHSVKNPSVVGIAKVAKTAYQDPTTEDKNWVVVDLVPYKALPKVITLAQIKAEPSLQTMALLKQSRLSVMPITDAEFIKIIDIAGLVI
jgi:predicted RNA-binding protein with PUA-like domain